MPTEILMPALSPTMEEGKLAKWVKNEGDSVAAGDVIAEIETDKATMEVEAVDEGTLGKILVEEGAEGVKVNTPIALLLAEGEDAREFAERVEKRINELADEFATGWWQARKNAYRKDTPDMNGPQAGAWRRRWALGPKPGQRRQSPTKKTWPNL